MVVIGGQLLKMEEMKMNPEEAKSRDQLEKEIAKLRTRLKLTQSSLIQARSQMELQSLRTKQLVSAWQNRMKEADDVSRRQREQKDRELASISSQLLFLQACLQKEQKRIHTMLAEKDQVIKMQKKKISYLKKVNVKMTESILILKQKFDDSEEQKHKMVNIFEQNGYQRLGKALSNEHLDFPDVFDDSGGIRTPNDVLDLTKRRMKSRDEGISVSSSPRSPREDSAYTTIAECTDAPNLDCTRNDRGHNTFPKRKPILKQSQSQGILSNRKPSFFIDPDSNPEHKYFRKSRSNSVVGTVQEKIKYKKSKDLRTSESHGNLTYHIKPRATFYIENDSQIQSADLDNTRQTSEVCHDSFKSGYHGTYPDLMVSANNGNRQRKRSNSLHTVTYQHHLSIPSKHDLDFSKGHRRLSRSDSTNIDETIPDGVFYSPGQRKAKKNAFSNSKHNAMRSKEPRRFRKRSTSEPGIEAKFAFLSLSEHREDHVNNSCDVTEGIRRVQSVEETV